MNDFIKFVISQYIVHFITGLKIKSITFCSVFSIVISTTNPTRTSHIYLGIHSLSIVIRPRAVRHVGSSCKKKTIQPRREIENGSIQPPPPTPPRCSAVQVEDKETHAINMFLDSQLPPRYFLSSLAMRVFLMVQVYLCSFPSMIYNVHNKARVIREKTSEQKDRKTDR